MENLIYIDEKDKYDASALANTFANEDTRNRAYFNALGAKLALKYLASEGIDVSGMYNIHSIKKILEDIDISDVRLQNINIDVRIIFDENVIFIPKSHFEYGIAPDIYLIFNLAQDFSNVKFLGFVEPKLINKNNENKDYYFIEKEKLSSPVDLKNYIEKFHKDVSEDISSEEIENSERIIISMADNDILEDDKKYLLKQLVRSAELRDKIIEYENFETLSYKVLSDTSVKKREIPLAIDELENFDLSNDFQEDFLPPNSIQANSLITEPVELTVENDEKLSENVNSNDFVDVAQENISLDNIELPAEPVIEGATFDDNMISLNNVETTENFVEDLQIDGVENISLDNIELPMEQVLEVENQEDDIENFLNLENIETNKLEDQIENLSEDIISDSTISLDNITIPEISENDNVDNEETLSLDNIELPTEDIEEHDEFGIETGNFNNEEASFIEAENFENLENSINLENIEELPIEDKSVEDLSASVDNQEYITLGDISVDNDEILDISFAEKSEQNINNDAILKSIDNVDISDEDLVENILPKTTVSNMVNDSLSDEIPDNEFEELVNVGENIENSSSFGKNLLDNLNEEDIEDVKIDTNQTGIENIDISSNDLLEQIDNILTTNSQIDGDDDKSAQNDSELMSTIEDYFSEETSAVSDENETSDLEMLFNSGDNDNTDSIDNLEVSENNQEEQEQPIPGAALINDEKSKSDKKVILLATTLISVIIAVSAITFLKPKTSQDIEPMTSKETNAPNEIVDAPMTAQNVETNTIETNTPNINSEEIKNVTKAQTQEIKNNPVPKKQTTESYMAVNKLVWDVSAEISANPQMQTYLKTAGKSIKLSLSADLLLANEYAYTNQIKVGLLVNANGSVQNASILASSGSTQIDNIVLQSVKETLNVIKPASGAVKTPDFKLTLIIYL